MNLSALMSAWAAPLRQAASVRPRTVRGTRVRRRSRRHVLLVRTAQGWWAHTLARTRWPHRREDEAQLERGECVVDRHGAILRWIFSFTGPC